MDEEAKMLIVTNEKDEDGFPVEKKQEIEIFVREKSATRAEYYEALRSGITIKIVLETRQEDWELSAHMVAGKKQYATQIEYDGSIYDVVRTYKNDKSLMEIICG
jgi:SPP1 family predicted phage head-tail adaptor